MTPQEKKDRGTLQKAIAEVFERGAGNRDALGRVLKTIRQGAAPTATQLRMVNATRDLLGLPRVSLPVRDREKKRAYFEKRSQTINSEFEALASSRPLSPPKPKPSDTGLAW
jgi:hypothetical protein